MNRKNLGPFIKKLLLFSIPIFVLFFAYYCLELFILPMDFFNFRAWESLYVKKYVDLLPGFVYPNVKLIKTEEGDIGHGSSWATHRIAEWETDQFGYRNRQ